MYGTCRNHVRIGMERSRLRTIKLYMICTLTLEAVMKFAMAQKT